MCATEVDAAVVHHHGWRPPSQLRQTDRQTDRAPKEEVLGLVSPSVKTPLREQRLSAEVEEITFTDRCPL